MVLAHLRTRALVASVVLAWTLAACGGAATTSPTSTTSPAATTTAPPTAAASGSTAPSATATRLAATATVASPASSGSAAGSPGGSNCATLTPDDIKAITGAEVHAIERLSKTGAGFTCANYATADGKLYLGISLAGSTGELEAMTPPAAVYPVKAAVSGVGDETTLYKTDDAGTVRFLVARKGTKGLALGPFSKTITDEQLGQLAAKALSRL